MSLCRRLPPGAAAMLLLPVHCRCIYGGLPVKQAFPCLCTNNTTKGGAGTAEISGRIGRAFASGAPRLNIGRAVQKIMKPAIHDAGRMSNTPGRPPFRGRLSRRSTLVAYSFILPNFIGFLCLTLMPILFSFLLSFMEWDSANPIKFVGLANFAKTYGDETFKISFINTIYYTLGTVPLTVLFSLLLAIVLNRRIMGKVFFRSVFFFPYVASLVAVTVVWNMLFHPDMGPVNGMLSFLGVQNPPRWSASIQWAMPTVIGLTIWKSTGYYMIVYIAALQGIPKDLYEAATIDGATAWQQFRKITGPMLTPTTFFVVMMLTISSFKVFDTIYIMTQGGPGRATNVLVYHIYNTAFIKFQFGYASAISVILFAMVLAITLIQFRVEKKWVSYM